MLRLDRIRPRGQDSARHVKRLLYSSFNDVYYPASQMSLFLINSNKSLALRTMYEITKIYRNRTWDDLDGMARGWSDPPSISDGAL